MEKKQAPKFNRKKSSATFWEDYTKLKGKISKALTHEGGIFGFISDEPYFVDRTLFELVDFLNKKQGFEVFHQTYFEFLKLGKDGFCGTDLFGERQVYIVSDAEKAFQKKAEWLNYKTNLGGSLVFFSASVSSGKRNSCQTKGIEIGVDVSCVSKLRSYEFSDYILSLEKHLKISLDDQSRKVIVALYQDQYALCDSFLRHLTLAVPDQKNFTISDISDLCGRGMLTALQTTEYLAAGRTGMTLGWIEQLIEEGEQPLALLGLLTRYTQDLAQVKRRNEGDSTNINPYVARKLSRAASQLSSTQIDSALLLCDEADTLFKSTKISPALIFGEIILSLSFT